MYPAVAVTDCLLYTWFALFFERATISPSVDGANLVMELNPVRSGKYCVQLPETYSYDFISEPLYAKTLDPSREIATFVVDPAISDPSWDQVPPDFSTTTILVPDPMTTRVPSLETSTSRPNSSVKLAPVNVADAVEDQLPPTFS